MTKETFTCYKNINSDNHSVIVPIYHLQAVVGEPVYLPCDISTITPNDAVLLVLWYREDLGTPIYSVDGRERNFSMAERWSDENVFNNRAYFMPDKKPAELGVDHIRDSDAGIYRCRVDFRIAQTRNSKVNLTVIVSLKTCQKSITGYYALKKKKEICQTMLTGVPLNCVAFLIDRINGNKVNLSLGKCE
ncbi:uncharacterized protein LOC123293023 [Chrysoperla carnea]|uniref:uncharacterized protein LOC123293023 n=1 Tax=Chrysoperla carnea TaxID=189513 RepID=UPI001D098E51|nr:uncharacterized protein LOC123293023 [Chrysoperla carnea]